MNLCAQCGKRHPKIRTVVLDKWLWPESTVSQNDLANWFHYAQLSHFRQGEKGTAVKLSGRTFTRTVRAGGACVKATVVVLARKEPWHVDGCVVAQNHIGQVSVDTVRGGK